MLRKIINRIQAKRLGVPIRTGDKGHYRVPVEEYVRADGEVRRELSAKTVMLVIIAEELGTDDPNAILNEYVRRCFVAHVRKATNTQPEQVGPVLPEPFRKEGVVIPFPGCSKAHSSVAPYPCKVANTANTVSSETLGASNSVLEAPEPIGTSAVAEMQPIDKMSAEAKPVELRKTEDELIQEAIESVLATASTDEERQIFREFLAQHPILARAAIDDHARLSLGVDKNGKAYAKYARYAQAIC